MSAREILNRILFDYGLSEREINILIAVFLEQEAFDYVNYIKQTTDAYDLKEDLDFCSSNSKYFS